MEAKIIDFAAWKQEHPPILICWQHGLDCALAWQALWLKGIEVFANMKKGK